jgi:hypothetical protein
MPVTKRTRFEVLKRDNHTCRYCGIAAPEVVLTVDHVTPTALGGSDDPSNLVAACRDCNAGKASTSPGDSLVADIAQKAVEWGAAIERYNAIRMADRRKRAAYTNRFRKAWDRWTCGGEKLHKPADWEPSIWQFYGLGLPIVELEEAVTIACSNRNVHPDDAFRYLCGVVKKKVEKMHEGARNLLDAEAANVS